MNFQTTYQDVYIAVLNSSGKIIGSGMAIDDEHIITCAHVVNAALKKGSLDRTESCVGEEVPVSFRLNENLGEDQKVTMAKVIKWFPSGKQLTLKTDLAVLRIENFELRKQLNTVSSDIEFVSAGEEQDHSFKMICFDTRADEQSAMVVTGKTSSYIREEGKTIIYPQHNSIPFIQSGCSGSPVYSEQFHGIIGLTQSLKRFNSQPEAKAGFILDIRAIAKLIPEILIKPKGTAAYGNDKHNLKLSFKRSHSKQMCNRREMVDYISSRIKLKKSKAVISFVCTDHINQESTDDIFIRYKSEFIDPELHEQIFYQTLRIPEISDLRVFSAMVRDDLIEGISYEYPIPEFTEAHSLSELLNANPGITQRPFFLVIDCDLDKITQRHLQCLEWLREFLSVESINSLAFDCHILFIGRHENPDISDALRVVKKGFETDTVTVLKDVSPRDINNWIDHFIGDQRKSILREQFSDRNYTMREIFEKYNNLQKLDLI